MASRQEEPEEYDEEYHSEVDRGIVAFLETLTAWIIAGFIFFLVIIPALKLIINGP